ncbi:subtilisin-like serine protease [Ceratobasidium sp. 394]|nr:subtilisin-like serine protease [Ceratobasidium sp. 394]KAG9077152.1 subtilisin-like serine protease [Ceratobasidium sp. UAMH 11750]
MRGLLSYLVAALAAVATLGSGVVAVSVTKTTGVVNPGSYIVLLHKGANMKAHKNWMDGTRTKLSKRNSKCKFEITNDYDLLNGYAAQLSKDTLAELAKSPDVAMIVQDGRCTGSRGITLPQYNAPWGIARVSRLNRLPPGSSVYAVNYRYYRQLSIRLNVDVYVLDTGINTDHADLPRASWGATFGGYRNADGHGHGTHIAGTIAGRRYGVAKFASVIAVKVLNDTNQGWNKDLIAGVNWAISKALTSGRQSVLSISITTASNPAVDFAVTSAISQGIHVVVCAGNNNTDASKFSPARAPSVITVGATDINDQRWIFNSTVGSNYGPAVDIWAPGADITSTWIGSDTATAIMTGTSMAVPHVSGTIAYLLDLEGPRSPADMLARLKWLAPDGVLSEIPPGTR